MTDPSELAKLQTAHDERKALLDVDVERAYVKDRIAKLGNRRAFLVSNASDDAEAGQLDLPAFQSAITDVDSETEDLEGQLEELDKADEDRADVAELIASILTGTVHGIPGTDSPELADPLRLEVMASAKGGKLSPFAIGECKWLASGLGIAVVVSSSGNPSVPNVDVVLDVTLGGDLGLSLNVPERWDAFGCLRSTVNGRRLTDLLV